MNKQKHILIFEPKIEGHHLLWLQLTCESFLDSGYRVTIALDNRTSKAQDRIANKNNQLLSQVSLLPIYNNQKNLKEDD